MKYLVNNFFSPLFADLKKNYILYLLILPVFIYYIIFSYIPLSGIQIAFRDYVPNKGFWGSTWVGLEHFQRFFRSYTFADLIKNTLGISIYSLIVGFPLPIIFALLLNYIKNKHFKRTIQMISYAPFFISTVVLTSILIIFMDPEHGLFNQFRAIFGVEPIAFLSIPGLFKSIYVWSGIWQGLGWSSIIYISALSSVDQKMHEASTIDGATKMQRIWHIDLPSILPTVIILLILQMGGIMNVGFEKIFLLQNDLNRSASDVIATYVYRVGLQGQEYSFSTAVGLFNSVINFILLITVNSAAKRFGETSLW